MGLVLCLIGFAAGFAVVMFIGSWISGSALGWGDSKFGDTAGNLRFVGQILPIVVTIATLSDCSYPPTGAACCDGPPGHGRRPDPTAPETCVRFESDNAQTPPKFSHHQIPAGEAG